MKIQLICVGTRPPKWVDQGVTEYTQRLPAMCQFKFIQIPALKRPKSAPLAPIIDKESEQLLAASPARHQRIALDERGQSWSTYQLSAQLKTWLQQGDDIDLFIGGPDGLSVMLLSKMHMKWSLSNLTLPHMLVRVIVAEQLYRACMILNQHPYHRP